MQSDCIGDKLMHIANQNGPRQRIGPRRLFRELATSMPLTSLLPHPQAHPSRDSDSHWVPINVSQAYARAARCVTPTIGQSFRPRTSVQLSLSLQKMQGKLQALAPRRTKRIGYLHMLVRCTRTQLFLFSPAASILFSSTLAVTSYHAVSSAHTRRTGTACLS